MAFWHDRPVEYSGGLNYIRNLLYAISLVNAGRLDPFLFLGTSISDKEAEGFAPLATVVRTRILERGSVCWFFDRLLVRGVGSHFLVKRELRRHGIHIVSHAAHVSGLGPSFRVVSWLPDFQFLHLPEFFPGLDVDKEIRRLRTIISQADAIVLSSHAAFGDFQTIAPQSSVPRARVLQFVSQPHVSLSIPGKAIAKQELERKYGLKGKYFHLPNQFWVHKNHWVVFRAVAELKARGTEILLVCTGNLKDYRFRNGDYVDALRHFVVSESLEANIRILGLIPYEDVLSLMRNSVAVVNPSRFEGWSSTVEEARSVGKRIALSNIAVHREQGPARAQYFDPDDVSGLCLILERWWNGPEVSNAEAESEAASSLRDRTLAYGEGYIRLVQQIA